MKKLMIILCICIPGLLIQCCKKDNPASGGTSHIAVRMTDAPGHYDRVMIDVQAVEVTGSASNSVMLNTKAGLYNLLDFTNGIDTLIAVGDMQPQTVQQIRLILGPNNSIVVDGVSYPLSTPSAEQSGLKINLNQTLQEGVTYAVLLDFDANQSIIQEGNGTYKLKPVIRSIDAAISGSIKGTINPIGTAVTIEASADGNTFTAVTDASGNFLLAGLPPGNYTVKITPPAPLLPVTLTDVAVMVGATTSLGIIGLK
jgi:hypothetical protein